MAINDGGATLKKIQFKVKRAISGKINKSHPKKVPNAKGKSGTPITGATRLMNQFGNNGVIRKNSM